MSSVSEALQSARPGTRADGHIAIGNLASGAQIAIPFVAVRGVRAGKTLWIKIGRAHV